MDTSFTLVVAGLLMLSMGVIAHVLNKRPTEPLIVALQAIAVLVLAVYAISDRSHRYISLVFVLIGTASLGRRVLAKYR